MKYCIITDERTGGNMFYINIFRM